MPLGARLGRKKAARGARALTASLSLADLRIALAAHGDSPPAGLLTRAPDLSVNEGASLFLLRLGLPAFPRLRVLQQRGSAQCKRYLTDTCQGLDHSQTCLEGSLAPSALCFFGKGGSVILACPAPLNEGYNAHVGVSTCSPWHILLLLKPSVNWLSFRPTPPLYKTIFSLPLCSKNSIYSQNHSCWVLLLGLISQPSKGSFYVSPATAREGYAITQP